MSGNKMRETLELELLVFLGLVLLLFDLLSLPFVLKK
jgi:hypothetical protein